MNPPTALSEKTLVNSRAGKTQRSRHVLLSWKLSIARCNSQVVMQKRYFPFDKKV